MCDTFVALPRATRDGATLFAKNADTEVNEVQAVIRVPAREWRDGALVRTTQIVIPQAPQTFEVILDKSFWTWGGEIGVNEHGVAIGNEALNTTVAPEAEDGLITMDLVRLMLERARTAREAVDVMAALLPRYGQGGNCELGGNAHFDSSYLVADAQEAWVIETAGREWFARRVRDDVEAISNGPTITDDWDLASRAGEEPRVDFAATCADHAILPKLGAVARRGAARQALASREGDITLRDVANTLRQHGEDYDPALPEVHENVCMHVGPSEHRRWQATGALIAEAGRDGSMAWVTATSGTCVSIFKPVFFGIDLVDTGPLPRETRTDGSLWWKHERLHRLAMRDFHGVRREIRHSIEALEDEFFAEAPSVLRAGAAERGAFVAECWTRADELTERWLAELGRTSLQVRHDGYRRMWAQYDAEADLAV